MKTKWYVPGEAYDWEKTIKHFLYGLVLTILASGITWSIQYIELANIPPEYTVYTGLLLAILQGISNLVKHWKDDYEKTTTP